MTQAAPATVSEERISSPRLAYAREDLAFLPADLEILETPPSPVRMAFVLALVAMTACALIWSYFGRFEIVASAEGKIQPVGRVKIVQPAETGKIARVYVQNGEVVHPGTPLLDMDTSDAEAEVESARTALYAYRAEAERRRAVIRSVQPSGIASNVAIDWNGDIPLNIRHREEAVLRDALKQLAAQVASADAQIKQKAEERVRLSATVAAQKDLLDTISQLVGIREALLPTAAGSRATYLETQQVYKTQRTVLTTQEGQLAMATYALDVLRSDREKAIATFVSENSEKLAEAERQSDEYVQRLSKATNRLERLHLVSPIEGTVTGLTVTTVGQVVTTAEDVMRIVPDSASLEIEAYLPDRDIAFVREGASAVVKLEPFPFTRYGTLEAVVVRVGHDAIPRPDAEQTEMTGQPRKSPLFDGAQRTQNLVYPITLKLKADEIHVDGETRKLKPGMSVVTEVATGKRRIIDYFLSPLTEAWSKSLKER